MRLAVTIAVCIATIYASICAAFYVMQGRLVYVPARALSYTPRHLGLAYDEVALTAEDGVRLSAWVVRGSASGRWMLYCHGNGGNLSTHLGSIRTWHRAGLNVLMFDYRGYGRSEGEPFEQGLYRDAEAAWRYLTETLRISPAEIVVYGESLGGGVATWLAEKHAPRALMLKSTFTSVADMGARLYPWLPARLLCRNLFPSVDRVARIDCPILFLHAPDDPLIPYEMGKQLYAASRASSRERRWLDVDGGHGAGVDTQSPQTQRAVVDFATATLGTPG